MHSAWDHKILDELVEVDPEQLTSSTDADFSFYYIDISSVSLGNINYPIHQIKFKGSPSRARKVLKYDDILMSSVRPNLKAFAQFKRKSRLNFIASTGFAVLRAKKGVDVDFIFQSLFSNEIEKQIDNLVVGSNYPAINSSDVRKLKVHTPPYPIQCRIAQILSTVDSVIENTQVAIAKYKAIKQGMLHDLFTRGIDVKTGKLRPKYKDAPGFYKESKLGMLPVKWEVERLKNLCSEKPTYGINAAAVEFTYQLPTYIRITDIDSDGNFSKTGRKCVNSPFSNQYLLKKGDLVFARTGATVGKTYLYDEVDGILVYAGFLIKVSPDEKKLDANFLKFYTESSFYWKWVSLMSQRSGQPGINGLEYGNLNIPYPDLSEQRIISDKLLAINKKIQTDQDYLDKLQSVKAGLMADLLSGKKPINV